MFLKCSWHQAGHAMVVQIQQIHDIANEFFANYGNIPAGFSRLPHPSLKAAARTFLS
jgi:hypothetical protein